MGKRDLTKKGKSSDSSSRTGESFLLFSLFAESYHVLCLERKKREKTNVETRARIEFEPGQLGCGRGTGRRAGHVEQVKFRENRNISSDAKINGIFKEPASQRSRAVSLCAPRDAVVVLAKRNNRPLAVSVQSWRRRQWRRARFPLPPPRMVRCF